MARRNAKHLNWLKKPRVRWGILAGVWVALVVMVVVPTWQGVLDRNAEIDDLETRLATLDDWAVAGMWLAPSVKERTLPVNAAFSRLFPDGRQREDLFLSLARVADQSQVESFTLSEVSESSMMGNDVWNDGSEMTAGDDPPPTDGQDSTMESCEMVEVVKVELSSYRVNTQFFGDYRRIAQFMNGLKSIDRAMKVHSLVINPQRDGIQVKLELDIYVNKTSQS